MGRRKYYSRKGLGKEIYAVFLIIILVVVREILTFIRDNQIIILIGTLLLGVGIILKFYIDYKSRVKEEESKQEYLRSCRSINNLLSKFKNKPTDFENYVANVFSYLGYKTVVTPPSKDEGRDIEMFKDGIKYAVEVKLYSKDNKITREKIQKLQGAMINCKADKGVFVTTSSFTKDAIEYGQKHGITLINGESFVKLIDKALGEELSHVNNRTKPIIMIDNLLE